MDTFDAYMTCIGNRIQDARKTAALTQAQLGERVGLSQRQVARLESGDAELVARSLFRIARELELDVREFVPPSDGRPATRTDHAA